MRDYANVSLEGEDTRIAKMRSEAQAPTLYVENVAPAERVL